MNVVYGLTLHSTQNTTRGTEQGPVAEWSICVRVADGTTVDEYTPLSPLRQHSQVECPYCTQYAHTRRHATAAKARPLHQTAEQERKRTVLF